MGHASLNPEKFSEGGGALPVNKNLVTSKAKYLIWDYGKPENGKTTTALCLTMKDEDGEDHIQYWSVGSTDRFKPSEDGQFLDQQAPGVEISKSSNFAQMMAELINAGFPANRLEDAKGDSVPVASIFDGLDALWIGIPPKGRENLVRTPEQIERLKKYPELVLVPSKINHLPGEKTAKGAGKGKGAASNDGFDPIKAALALYNKEVAKAGGTQTRAKVAQASFKDKDLNAGGIANAEAVRSVLFEPEMVAALEADGFTVKGENVSKE